MAPSTGRWEAAYDRRRFCGPRLSWLAKKLGLVNDPIHGDRLVSPQLSLSSISTFIVPAIVSDGQRHEGHVARLVAALRLSTERRISDAKEAPT
jgi:hypothetical protein